MTAKEYIKEHPEQFKDEIDKWLFAECGIIGGCCSSQGSLQYSVGRQVAEKLWNKPVWKNAQGDDLPEIDREVIALVQDYPDDKGHLRVVYAHRPPERWYGRDLDGEEHIFKPKTYDKGEWNIPNIVWWLDLDLPIKGE